MARTISVKLISKQGDLNMVLTTYASFLKYLCIGELWQNDDKVGAGILGNSLGSFSRRKYSQNIYELW